MYGSQGVKASNAQLDKLSRVCLIVHYLPPLPLSLSVKTECPAECETCQRGEDGKVGCTRCNDKYELKDNACNESKCPRTHARTQHTHTHTHTHTHNDSFLCHHPESWFTIALCCVVDFEPCLLSCPGRGTY